MYLSKLKLDVSNHSVRKALSDCSEMHRDIQRIFNSNRESNSILYRVVEIGRELSVYISSDTRITSDMIENNGYSLVVCKDMEKVINSISDGDVIRFDLVAYPSKKVSEDGRKNSRRVFLRSVNDQLEWLNRKAEQNGFSIESVEVEQLSPISCRSKASNLRLNRARFSGILTVNDRELFVRSVESGIGPEKSYGMGLLMLI